MKLTGVIAAPGLNFYFVVREDRAGLGKRRRQFLPFADPGIAFHQFHGWPIAVLRVGEERLIDVGLPAAGDDDASAPGDHGDGLVVVRWCRNPPRG
jgi:hypothetical protein